MGGIVKSAKLVGQTDVQKKKSSNKAKSSPKKAYPGVIQLHHLDGNHKNDDPANHAYISRGEHFLLGRLAWYTKNFVSEDFVKALWDFVNEKWLTSVNLKTEYMRRKECQKKPRK